MSIDLGLGRLERFVDYFPPYNRPTVHISGTNGKGSVAAILTSILLASRPPLRIGRYNSPHLISILDCITIDNKSISPSLYEEARKDVEEVDRKHGTHLTNFELLTMTALVAFERMGVDIVILEVGMGGRLDATNIVPTGCVLASVLTAVDLDHQTFLGNNIAEIAKEKAGIAREGKPFILGKQANSEVGAVVNSVLKTVGGLLFPSILVEKDTDDSFEFSLLASSCPPPSGQLITAHIPCFPATTLHTSLPLHGTHQRDNLATALAVISALLTHDSSLSLTSRVTPQSIEEGIRNVSWPGRLSFHTIDINTETHGTSHFNKLLVLADGAHNPASAETLGAYIDLLLESTLKVMPSTPFTRPLLITYILGLSHSPPKTPLQTLEPLFRPVQPSETTSALNIQPAVALLQFTPPDEMPWVKSVPTATLRETVSHILPSLGEHDVWVPAESSVTADGSRNRALEEALKWAAKRHSTVDDGEHVSGLVVLAGSLYLVADFYRLIEGGTLDRL